MARPSTAWHCSGDDAAMVRQARARPQSNCATLRHAAGPGVTTSGAAGTPSCWSRQPSTIWPPLGGGSAAPATGATRPATTATAKTTATKRRTMSGEFPFPLRSSIRHRPVTRLPPTGTVGRMWGVRLAAALLGIATVAGPTHTATLDSEQQLPLTFNQGVARVSDGWILSGTNSPLPNTDVLVRTNELLVPTVTKPNAIPQAWRDKGYDHI